jgi:hypothetical protein
MKYSQTDSAIETNADMAETKPSRSIFGRIKAIARSIIADCRAPLPNAESLTRFGRIKARFSILYRKYGWKLLVGIFCYYLVRDVTLYIIIPYLAARHFLGD